jgi:hypothetical protein
MGVSPMRVDWNGKCNFMAAALSKPPVANLIFRPHDVHGRDAHATARVRIGPDSVLYAAADRCRTASSHPPPDAL